MLVLRLGYLQIPSKRRLEQIARGQRISPTTVDAQRGAILDRNFQTLAVSIGADAVWVVPSEIEDFEATAKNLAPYLSLSESEILTQLKSRNNNFYLERKLTPQASQAIRDMRMPGIRLLERPQRFYPHKTMAAHVLGIAGVDNQGLEGLEYQYESLLAGTPGTYVVERDAARREIPAGESDFIPPVNGYDLVLTLDATIQFIAEKELEKAVLETKSEKGLILIVNQKTGEILANAIYPTFDPNDYQKYPASARRNIAVTDQYEPGSTFKIVTAAAALDLGLTHPERMFETIAVWEVGGGKIHNVSSRVGGSHSFKTAFIESNNITFAQISVEMGPHGYYPYLRTFGFGSRLGIDFPGEARGIVPYPGSIAHGETLQWANIGFGQGVAVTPIQLLMSVAAIGNGGKVMRPYYVKEIRDSLGKIVEITESEVLSQPISESTAQTLNNLLRSTVVEGTANLAEISGYYVAGKTGTAQVPEQGVYGENRIASFVGYAPYDNPQVAALVVLYSPQTEIKYGGVLAAPLFATVVEQTLEYLKVPRRIASNEKGSTVVVPNVRNYPTEQAIVVLTELGLKVNAENTGSLVLEQIPNPGTRVPRNSTVDLIYYDQDDLQMIKVPSVIGMSIRDATVKLTESSLRVQIQGSGVAKSQRPQAGVMVPAGSVIEVVFEP
ncbi:MAG: PASTA domain-containing protein [Firmicutes bacterium]|nr:PASTA domain-containing protein [Bacillota bacterium]